MEHNLLTISVMKNSLPVPGRPTNYSEFTKSHIFNNEAPTVHNVKLMQQQHGATF
jgi:hypothetical protein